MGRKPKSSPQKDSNNNNTEMDFDDMKSSNKKMKVSHNGFGTDAYSSTIDPIKANNDKQNIFKYNPDELFECFLFHGVSNRICETFLGEFDWL
jgi:hypothetical protein